MSNSEQVKKDQEHGLMVKQMSVASKHSDSTIIKSAILRAARRKRISEDTANRCIESWSSQVEQRPHSLFWNIYAANRLLEVAKRRQQGNLASAKIILCDVRFAIRNSRISLH